VFYERTLGDAAALSLPRLGLSHYFIPFTSLTTPTPGGHANDRYCQSLFRGFVWVNPEVYKKYILVLPAFGQ